MRLSRLVPLQVRTTLYRALPPSLRPTPKSAPVPRVELEDRHLVNLRVVSNRRRLLELLPKGGIVAELGVADGDFSVQILEFARPSRLHLIDAWHTPRFQSGLKRVEERFREPIGTGAVQLHHGLSVEQLSKFADHYFDWIYIDTTHSYHLTAQELALGRLKVKPGGILAGHDYVTGNWDGGCRYGVVEAVNEFCGRHEWEFLYLTHETDRHLSFAIRAISGR